MGSENGWAQIIRPPQYLDGDQNRMLSLTEQGARITFEATGTVGRFDFAAFISWLVNTVVLLGVSRFVADIVAFNLLGKDSEVYARRVAGLVWWHGLIHGCATTRGCMHGEQVPTAQGREC